MHVTSSQDTSETVSDPVVDPFMVPQSGIRGARSHGGWLTVKEELSN